MASVVAKDNFRPVMADSKVVSARAIAAAAATAAALQRQQQQQQQQQKPKGINCIFNLEDYKWGENERPLIAHDEFEHAKLIPMIDMSGGGGDKPILWSAQMAAAARDWGFFQVVGHGVSEELLRRMESHARAFFELDFDQKKRILRDGSSMKPMGYSCGGCGTNLKRDLPWLESLQLPCSSAEMEPFATQLWLDRNSCAAAEFRKAANEFSDAMKAVALRILGALLNSIRCEGIARHPQLLGRAENAVIQDGRNSVIRFNCYPPCPQPSMTLGLGSHSDPHLLTVLHQDLVGGLQICRNGQWITVKPSRGSLVINIGDALQVWSNDAYKSVEHRAVCNSLTSRLSMAFFLNPMDKATIRPITSDPPLYKPFTWEEYRQHMYKNRPRGKSNLVCFRV